MTKVFCPLLECVNNKNQRCFAKELRFKMTISDASGKNESFICDQFLMADDAVEFDDQFKELLKRANEENYQ